MPAASRGARFDGCGLAVPGSYGVRTVIPRPPANTRPQSTVGAPDGDAPPNYRSPSAFIMESERAKASTVASISASPCVADTVPPGQPVKSTPFTIMASRSF